jgi:hypothetical protein
MMPTTMAVACSRPMGRSSVGRLSDDVKMEARPYFTARTFTFTAEAAAAYR